MTTVVRIARNSNQMNCIRITALAITTVKSIVVVILTKSVVVIVLLAVLTSVTLTVTTAASNCNAMVIAMVWQE